MCSRAPCFFTFLTGIQRAGCEVPVIFPMRVTMTKCSIVCGKGSTLIKKETVMNRQRYRAYLTRLSIQLLITTAVCLPTSALRTTDPHVSQHRLDPNSGLSVRMKDPYEVPLRIDQPPPFDPFGAPDLGPSYVQVPVPSHTSHVRSSDNSGSPHRVASVVTQTFDPDEPSYVGADNRRSNASTCVPPDQCRNAGDCAAGGDYSSCGSGRMCCPPRAALVYDSHAQNTATRNPGKKGSAPPKSSVLRETVAQGNFDEGLPAAFHGYLLLSEYPQRPATVRSTQSGNPGFAQTKSAGRTHKEPVISPEYESGRYGGPPVRLGSAGTTLLSNLKQKEINLLPDDEICGFLYADSRIIRGHNADIEEFPWMVLLGFRSPPSTAVNFICAGTLINKRYVLTAAHCFTNQNVLVEVRLGEYDLSKDPDGPPENRAPPVRKEEAEEIIIHPNFSRSQLSNDIALIRLKNRIREYTNTIKPICLPLDVSFMDANYTVAGWGKTDYSHSNGSNIIQKTVVTLMNHTDCLNRAAPYNQPITTNQICAGGNQGHDVCFGDSGGPLTKAGNANTPGAQSRVYIVGIVSFGADMPCGTAGLPSVYTNVKSYLSWILENIRA